MAVLWHPCYLVGMLVARSGLDRDLRELGVGPGGLIMVHCRLSEPDRVVGGAETVVRSLLDVLGPEGTLLTYTGWQDAPHGDLDAGSRRIYLEEHPAYDLRVALSSRDHGRVPEALRTWPGSRHSGHPEAGVAAVGFLAETLTTCHPRDDAYGAGTPYARLPEMGGQEAMLGAPLETVTLVHHTGAVAKVPGQRRVVYRNPVFEGAPSCERVLGGEDYVEHLALSALAAGIGEEGTVGAATAYLFDVPGPVAHAVVWVERTFPLASPADRE